MLTFIDFFLVDGVARALLEFHREFTTEEISMFGKHFLYILCRENGICHKIGVSSDIRRRINDLNRQFGPFCLERSLVLRADSRSEAVMLETAMKQAYSSYNTPLPEDYTDGGTEWFAEECYSKMCSSLAFFAEIRMGEGYSIESIDPAIFKPITENSKSHQVKFDLYLESRKAQIKSLCQNTLNLRRFRSAVKSMTPSLIGVTRAFSNGSNHSYELFLSLDTSLELIDEIFSAPRLNADNDEVWAGANLCISTQTTLNYIKATFSIPEHRDHFEDSWESTGKISTYTSILDDLARKFPVPPAYQIHVGRTFWDELPPEEISEIFDAIRLVFFGHRHQDIRQSENQKKRGSKKKFAPLETVSTQLSLDFSGC